MLSFRPSPPVSACSGNQPGGVSRQASLAGDGKLGLGYVGLPLAVEFGKKYPVTGFDIKQARIGELKAGRDSTREVEPAVLPAPTF